MTKAKPNSNIRPQSRLPSGIILAGGQSSRFGGSDKGLIEWQGQAMIEHVITRIGPQLDKLAISVRHNADSYKHLKLPCLIDEQQESQGPLAGIARALADEHELMHEQEFLLVVPCDTPQLPCDLVKRLMAAAQQHHRDLCYAHDGERGHFLCCLIHRRALAPLQAYIKSGKRSMYRLIEQLNSEAVDFSDQARAFININDAQELATLANTGSEQKNN
ncbi:molybdenum cofactor guanylyltransferase [Sinobacterium caligoides]|uniref:Molybdenum cofactor guanylyltransferase n=1 Tax=Sinobacterium caligoides TaxID=933926 RepID=A0A3N2DZG6_9GAMM|nr:molybdenum cofactor guanylyltransferase MobA [Sinobacterium caligoides]ROS04705.1 molybdenum cofactor guanylyltransferase [Sinobacterium caligoides]